MSKALIAAGVLTVSLAACKGTGKEGEYEIEKPVIGTVTDTIRTPTIDARMDSATVAVPKVDVRKDSATIKVPKIEVKKP